MSDVCQQLEAFHFDLRLIHRDGIDLVEAKRTEKTKASAKVVADLLLQLSRAQEEAIAYLRPRRAKYMTQRMWEIEDTLKKVKVGEDEEAALIYEFCDLAAQAGLGPAKSSDGFDWSELRNTL